MVRVRNFFLVAVAAALFSMGNTVNAGVVFDNLSTPPAPPSTASPPAYVNPDPLSGDGPQFASFSTGGAYSGLTLSDVKLLISGDNTSTNSFTVSLLSDNGSNSPGTSIATLGTFGDGTLKSTPTVYDISGLSAALAATTRYWIELSGASSSVAWGFAQDATGVGVSTEYDAYYNGLSYGVAPFKVTSNMDLSVGGPYQMQVTTVPEPGTFGLALSALGIGMIGIAGRRLTRSC